MRIGITGSRSIRDRDYIIKCLNSVLKDYESPFVFLTGGAKGVDNISSAYLGSEGFDIIVLKTAKFYCQPIPYNPLLYKARNSQIVYNSDILIAIWDGSSRGTKMTMNLAESIGLKVIKFIY